MLPGYPGLGRPGRNDVSGVGGEGLPEARQMLAARSPVVSFGL